MPTSAIDNWLEYQNKKDALLYKIAQHLKDYDKTDKKVWVKKNSRLLLELDLLNPREYKRRMK